MDSLSEKYVDVMVERQSGDLFEIDHINNTNNILFFFYMLTVALNVNSSDG